MASELTRRFIEALQGAERTGDIGPLIGLFADDAELSNLGDTEPSRGRAGAVRFWRDYLGVFQQIRSTFTTVLEGNGTAALEWVSEGDLPGGHPIRYAGVSLLEMEDGRIKRLPADSAVALAGNGFDQDLDLHLRLSRPPTPSRSSARGRTRFDRQFSTRP